MEAQRHDLILGMIHPILMKTRLKRPLGDSQEDNKNTPVKKGQPVNQVAPQTALLTFLCES